MSRDHVVGQVARFGLMTAMSAAITVGLPVLLFEVFGVEPRYGTAAAFVVAFLTNFVSLRLLVFRSEASLGRDLRLFVLSSLAFRVVEYGAFLLLSLILGVHYVIALVAVLATSTGSKFLWYRFAMHRRSARPVPAGSPSGA